ncbi:MAG: heterodisulfide reductase subunit [Clostridia bacterium]|nr:heterodisulfide reductase subunit [Clostridia bacterium]
MPETIILYPGCLVLYRFPEYELAAKVLLQHLGYRVTSLPETLCCGSFLEGVTPSWVNYTAYNLALAEKVDAPVVTLCGGCTNTFRRFQQRFQADPQLREQVNTRLGQAGLALTGPVQVEHLIQVLWQRRRELQAMVTRPLPFQVNPVYPCQVYRPGEVMKFDDPLKPRTMADLVSLAGAIAVPYPGEYQCCGSSLYMIQPELALAMGKNRVAEMQASGADLAVTACGNCHLLLQRLQPQYLHGTPFPIIFLPQLMGLALGLAPAHLGLTSRALRRLLTLVS